MQIDSTSYGGPGVPAGPARLILRGLALTMAGALFLAGCDCEIIFVPERCGDGLCRGSENCASCPEDCGECHHVCGDGMCSRDESCWSCPADCGPCSDCGDGICDATESCSSCPADCGYCAGCGDGICDAPGETCETCPADCGQCSECGDGTCDDSETCASCPQDCGVCHGDASAAFAWTILGVAATGTVCDSVGGSAVQLRLDPSGDGEVDYDYEFNCAAGSARTPEDFTAGETVRYAFALLDTSGRVLAQSEDWSTHVLEPGVNDLGTVDFVPAPVHDAAVSLAWTIHYLPAGDALCGTMGARSVQLRFDETGDGTADGIFDFTCGDGFGSTGFVFDSGFYFRYVFALLDAGGDILSQSGEWDSLTLVSGNNDLGEINFIVGDYGPLSVDIFWADAADGPAFGGCDFPPGGVSVMGYLLCRDGLVEGGCPPASLYDEVDIDISPVVCRETLSWNILDFGLYELIIDGKDETGGTLWGAGCGDIVVDGVEPGSNEYPCHVLMAD